MMASPSIFRFPEIKQLAIIAEWTNMALFFIQRILDRVSRLKCGSSQTYVLRLPCLLVSHYGTSQSIQIVDTSLIHIESRKSPTAVLFDDDNGRISIRHCEILKSINLNVLAVSQGSVVDLQFCWSQTSHTNSSDEILKPFFGKGFSKHVSQLVFSSDKVQFNYTVFNLFFDEMILSMYVLGTGSACTGCMILYGWLESCNTNRWKSLVSSKPDPSWIPERPIVNACTMSGLLDVRHDVTRFACYDSHVWSSGLPLKSASNLGYALAIWLLPMLGIGGSDQRILLVVQHNPPPSDDIKKCRLRQSDKIGKKTCVQLCDKNPDSIQASTGANDSSKSITSSGHTLRQSRAFVTNIQLLSVKTDEVLLHGFYPCRISIASLMFFVLQSLTGVPMNLELTGDILVHQEDLAIYCTGVLEKDWIEYALKVSVSFLIELSGRRRRLVDTRQYHHE
ncbi:hypothetical protein Tco_1003742 [Tanacetum coccineum]|uniref:Uncharacterized protein n=1 Tax=Tanacetum coccineum TaxID=301880 RepID=A0ABQ5FAK6_9ASTR